MKKATASWTLLEMTAMIIVMTIAYYIFTMIFKDAWSNTFATLLIISVFVLWLYFTLMFRR